jgi:hypothetical protein
MNMLFRSARSLIAVGAVAVVVATPAPASDIEQAKSFKLAMGPMSAAQKNQGAAEKTDEVEIKPHHHGKHRRQHHSG